MMIQRKVLTPAHMRMKFGSILRHISSEGLFVKDMNQFPCTISLHDSNTR
jgi:hypothetical protein